jgi:lysophospholipid acyltransferase (LPLAT)-like uncharacterized protein
MKIATSLSYIAWAVISLWSRSLRVRTEGRHVHDLLVRDGRNVIYAFWHDSMFLLPAAHRGSGVVIMVSESRDGEIAAGMLRLFGFEVARGSSRRGGARGLIHLISQLRRGKSVAIAVDGPRGPRHEAKEGALFLAGSTGFPIIPVATCTDRRWTLERTWEKFIIPVPFSAGVIQYGHPIAVNGTSKEEIAAKRSELETALDDMTKHAAAFLASQRSETRVLLRGRPWSSR